MHIKKFCVYYINCKLFISDITNDVVFSKFSKILGQPGIFYLNVSCSEVSKVEDPRVYDLNSCQN